MEQSIIKFTSKDFDNFVKSKGRDYSIIAMTTALQPSRGCQVCGEAYTEYKILVNSVKRNHAKELKDKKVFFAMIDYDDASDVFHFLGLNSAPGFFHFGKKFTGKVDKSDKLDLNRQGFSADKLAKFASDKTGFNGGNGGIKVSRPIDYTNLIIFGFFVSVVIILGYFVGFKWSWLQSNSLWAFLSICIILIMTSGQMWNHIRNPPPMGRGAGGRGMSMIAPSSQQQYVFETYAVGLLYFLTSLSIIIMGDFASNPKTSNGKRRVLGFVGALCFVLVYSATLSIFGQKYAGYPYKLLF